VDVTDDVSPGLQLDNTDDVDGTDACEPGGLLVYCSKTEKKME
jgi:hypothetical protein